MEQTCVPVRHDPPATVSSVAGGGAGGTAVVRPGMVLARVSRPARTLTRGGRRNVAFGRPTAGCSIDLWSTCHVPRMDLAGESSLLPVIAAVLTARLSGQQVMINGNALHAPSSSRLRSLSARNPGPHGAPAARRGRTASTAARISVVSWACPLAVAKKVRPSQKVTGLPGPLRRRSAPIADSVFLAVLGDEMAARYISAGSGSCCPSAWGARRIDISGPAGTEGVRRGRAGGVRIPGSRVGRVAAACTPGGRADGRGAAEDQDATS